MSYLITNFRFILLRSNKCRCQELGLEYLHPRSWMGCLCLFYKVLSNKVVYLWIYLYKYIYELILSSRDSFRNPNLVTRFSLQDWALEEIFFFLVAINDWNILDPKMCDSTSYLNFRKVLTESRFQQLI